jgi:hypothetical protein
MKKLLLALLFTLGSFAPPLFAQSATTNTTIVKIDPRLYEAFEKVDLDKWQKEDPFLIQRWNFYLDNAYYIVDEALLDEKELTTYGDRPQRSYPFVEVTNFDNLNIIKIEREQNLVQHWEKQTFYRIKGTNKLLVFYPGQYVMEQFNNYLKRNY